MESEKSVHTTRNIAIGIGVAIVVVGFIVFAVAKSKSNVVATSKTSSAVQAPPVVDCKYTWDEWKCDNTSKKATRKPLVTTEASGGGIACPAPEVQDCNDCEYMWGNWVCDNTTKVATKTAVVTKQASGGGKACPAPQVQPCSDCEYTWGDFNCDTKTNKATKTPNITKQAFGGGKECPAPVTQGCNDCQYTWGDWVCNDTTKVATKSPLISKQASVGGQACPDPQVQPCSDCKYTPGDWICDTTIGKATKSPNITTQAFGGGQACPAPQTQSCALDCQYTWGNWTCDKTTGISKREANVTVQPLGGGQACPTAQTGTCALDCQYSWNDWVCDKTTGNKTRTPNISKQPSGGGQACPAPETGICDVDCVVTYPTTWGACDKNTGTQTMTGTVTTARQNNGKACDPLTKTQACKVDCEIEWSNVWGPCNYQTQTQNQNGVVSVTAKNNGAACGDLTQLQNCTSTGPYVYTTQVFAGQNPSTSFSQTGIPPNWGPSKVTTYGGLCTIDLNFTAWSPTNNNTGVFALLIDGVAQLPLITFCFNAAGHHMTIPSVFLSLYLSPGEHTFSLCVNYNMTNTPVAVDNNDFLWLRVVEYSQQLVAGPNPSVYVTNVFNQTPPTNDNKSYQGPGIPPGWTKTVVTRGGGAIIVDLNFTAYTKTTDQHIYFALMIDGVAQTPLIHWYNYVYTDIHKTIPASFTVYQLTAGSHTFAISTNYGTSGTAVVDLNDTLNMRITEFSTSLISSYILRVNNIISMVTPTSGFAPNFVNSNTWYRNFTTYGGTCLFNISYSSWINAGIVTSDGMMAVFGFMFSNSKTETSIRNSNTSNGVAISYNTTNSDGTKFFTVNNYFYMNVRSEHRTMNCNFIIDNLPAGNHEFRVGVNHGGVFVDPGDTMNMRLIELSPTLTGGTPPALPPALTASTKPTPVGCYTDNVNGKRVFNQMVDNQTLGQCNTIAKTAASPYFGMQNWQKSGGITAMDTGECWFQSGSTLQGAQNQGSSTSCSIGTAGYSIGGANANAVYKTL